jgi:FkbM family methyltransferase
VVTLRTITSYPLGRAVKYRLRNGRKFVVHPKDALSFKIFGDSAYEELETEFATSLLEKGDAIDIGANVGYFTALFSELVKDSGKVYSIEPGAQTYNKLLDTIGILGLKNVVAKQFVLGSRVGHARFLVSNNGMDQHQHVATDSGTTPGFEAIDLPAITVDAFVLQQKISPAALSLIKCDVEANELEVLRGSTALFAGNHPPVWLIEFRIRDGDAYDEKRLQELFTIFDDYTCYYAELGKPNIKSLPAMSELNVHMLPELLNLFAFPKKGIHSAKIRRPPVQQWIQQHSCEVMRCLLLRDDIPWFGGHTGYEQFARHLADIQPIKVITARCGQMARYLGSTYARLHGRMGRGATDLGELEFRLRRKLRRPETSHILYLEHHLDLLKTWNRAPKDLVGTIHLPASVWNQEQRRLLSRLNSALVLYQGDIPLFEKYVGRERVKFIHHGADTEFFKSDESKLQTPPRILYSGVYLRNEPMLVQVVQRLAEAIPELCFDLLVPYHHRKSPALAPLLKHPAVSWHAGLNDEQLRALYQHSHLMLLPMNDSGANTAVVEALASGLPIVTTDVGGIRDYGGGTIFSVVANDDTNAMVALVEQYLSKPAWRAEISQKCRRFAEDNLAWPVVAQKHLQIYRELNA